MVRQSFLQLWWRNIRGTFNGGYESINRELGGAGPGVQALVHSVLLPLTLTIGAFIKTLIDAYKRDFSENHDIDSLKKKHTCRRNRIEGNTRRNRRC